MTCDDRTDSIYLYAAGGLPEDEAAALRAHLAAGCPGCAAELAGATSAVAQLAWSSNVITPPPGLKGRLMRRIDAESKKLAVPPFAYRLLRALAPAAVAAGLTLVVTHFWMQKKLDVAQRQTMLSQQDAAGWQQMATSASVNAQADRDLVDMLRSSDVRLVLLSPTDLQKGAVARLVWDQAHGKWAVLVTGMKQADPGQTYEVWFVTAAGQKVRAGLFDVDRAGTASAFIDVPAKLGPLQLMAVTNEKAGGADQPHGSFQLTGNL